MNIINVIGVSLFGIFKNVYALSLGCSDGLEMGSNFRSCMALQAIKEMKALVKEYGGREETAFTCAGIADFLATGFSPHSRNYSYGFHHARNEVHDRQIAEGVENIAIVVSRLTSKQNFPLLNAIEKIFLHKKHPRPVLERSLDFF